MGYPIPNPFFLGRIQLKENNTEHLDISPLMDTLNTSVFGENVKKLTDIGYVKGTFKNEDELYNLKDENTFCIEDFYNVLSKQVDEYFEV